ncbi:TenA family protein [Tropicimonas sp. IMCC34043]|uniref:TenA family protein n=1 Tax=Tropicimonas sp. IMCC34043 TaxID=2248760 RepID=UPI001300A50F|nr:thiaminase II [Tropicimonas sp. IMCC34043]
MGDFGKSFELLRDVAAPQWQALTGHAFFEELALGTLPEPAFARHLALEYHRLVHLARGWAIAVSRSESAEEMQIATLVLSGLVLDEIDLQAAACLACGLDDDDLVEAAAAPATCAASQPVLEAAMTGDLADILAAIVPGMFARAEVGRCLVEAGAETPFAGWIETFASPEYRATCNDIGTLLDAALEWRLGADPTASPRWNAVCARFAAAAAGDRLLWDSALRG